MKMEEMEIKMRKEKNTLKTTIHEKKLFKRFPGCNQSTGWNNQNADVYLSIYIDWSSVERKPKWSLYHGMMVWADVIVVKGHSVAL